MDLVTFAFLALIVLVSGGIAYFADWLGRKLGKKRLRLGNLRPKHTANLGVIVSGFLISVVTIGLVYGLSSDVRQWIREGRGAIRKLNEAVAQRDAAEKERQKIVQLNKVLKFNTDAEIARAKATLTQLNQKTEGLQAQIRANRVTAQTLESKLAMVQREYDTSRSSLLSTEAQRKQAEMALSHIHTQVVALQDSFKKLRTSYVQLSSQNKDIQDYNLKVTKENLQLIASNADLDAKRNALAAQNRDATDSLDRLNRELDSQTRQVQDMTTEIRLRQKERDMLNSGIEAIRERPLTFSSHEELGRIDLPAKVTPQDVRDAITSLLRTARSEADARGAKSAAIFQHEDPKTHQQYEPEEIVDRMIRQVAGRPGEQVLVATSTYNAFQGETVSIDLTAYPNPLVYKARQVVAETRIDGTSSEETILARVNAFLRKQVHDRAKSDHLIPTGDDSFGVVDGAEILKIVKNVQSADRQVRLQAIARLNTRAGDPLQIELRIR